MKALQLFIMLVLVSIFLNCNYNNLPKKHLIQKCDTTLVTTKGDSVIISLKSQISTGYAWEKISVNNLISKENSEGRFVQNNEISQKDGSTEFQLFKYKIKNKSGIEKLEFHLKRNFGKNKTPINKCMIILKIE